MGGQALRQGLRSQKLDESSVVLMFKKELLPTFRSLETPHEILPLTENGEPHAQMTALPSVSGAPL